MSRRRKPNSRRPTRPRSASAISRRTKITCRYFAFTGPEELVTTFEVEHPTTLGRKSGGRAPPDATIIKGCPSRYALESCGTLQMGTLSYYRKHGDSLIWDMQEGVIVGDERVEHRHNDPTDIDAYIRGDADVSMRHPLGKALGATTIERLDVRETSRAIHSLGDSCPIWCASLEPQSTKAWDRWWESLEPHYDHCTRMGDPAAFARALTMMALPKRGLLDSHLELRNPTTGDVVLCSNLAVFYGPVVYLDNPQDYILKSADNVELIVRWVFTKTTEHRHQREYRFAILPQHPLNDDTVHLQAPHAMRQALHTSGCVSAVAPNQTDISPTGYIPPPRLRRCFTPNPVDASGDSRGISFSARMRAHLHISGTREETSRQRQFALSVVGEIDHDAIDEAIRAEPRQPDDARIAKVVIDGGPGTVISVCCLEGVQGEIRIASESGQALAHWQVHDSVDATEAPKVLTDNTAFDGHFRLTHHAQQLILSVVPMNPAATVEIDQPYRNQHLPQNHISLSPMADTMVTVTATSEDGTRATRFEIVVDSALSPDVHDEVA